MHVNFAHLCDYAIVATDGKLSVLGIFETIRVRALPAVHPRMILAFQLEPDYSEIGNTFEIVIRCVDQDGRTLFGLSGQVRTGVAEGKTLRPGDRPHVNQIMGIETLRVERPGPHDIHILINGERRGGVQFTVEVLPAAPATSPPVP